MSEGVARARCITGIEGLDSILGGGIPAGSMVLVTGVPGAGKTSLSLEFAIRGAVMGEKSLVLTTVERPEKLLSSVPEYDFYDYKLMMDGTLAIMEVQELLDNPSTYGRPETRDDMIKLAENLSKYIGENEIKRLVVDSFSTMFYGFEDGTIVRDMLLVLSEMTYVKNCTCMLISDADPKVSIESLIADGVIVLGNHERKTDLLRTMQVLKMKAASHSRSKYVIDLTSAGVLVTPMLRGGI